VELEIASGVERIKPALTEYFTGTKVVVFLAVLRKLVSEVRDRSLLQLI